MYNPDNKCFVKVSLELIPEHLLCKYNEHKNVFLITWQIFDHMITVLVFIHVVIYLVFLIFDVWSF